MMLNFHFSVLLFKSLLIIKALWNILKTNLKLTVFVGLHLI